MIEYKEVMTEEQIITALNAIELLPMKDARHVLSGDSDLLLEMATVDENKGRVLRLLKLFGDLIAIKKRDYYKAKLDTLDSLTDEVLESKAQVRSNKDSYAKAINHEIRKEWDYVENRYRYYDKLNNMLEERINLYKKFLIPVG